MIWLRQFEVDGDSSGAARLLDRLAFLQGLELSPDALSGNPPHPPAQTGRTLFCRYPPVTPARSQVFKAEKRGDFSKRPSVF